MSILQIWVTWASKIIFKNLQLCSIKIKGSHAPCDVTRSRSIPYPGSIDVVVVQLTSSSSSSSSTGSWPKNFDISTMVYGITIRLAGMKALAVTKQLWANCVGSLRETDAGVRYPQNKDFSRTVGTTATKLTGMTVPPVSNPRQTNSDCTIRQTRSLFYQLKLTTAAIFTW